MTAPRTEAGKRLLAFWRLHRAAVHGVTDQNDAIEDDIAAIEAEAAADTPDRERRLREALGRLIEAALLVDRAPVYEQPHTPRSEGGTGFISVEFSTALAAALADPAVDRAWRKPYGTAHDTAAAIVAALLGDES